MAYSNRSYARSYSMSGSLPPGIKWLLIVNVGLFLLQYLSRGKLDDLFSYFALYPSAVVKLFFVWQLATYMFLHGGIWHILWNMLALWMFGVEIERLWGTRKFIKFYFFCGIGAGICIVLLNLFPFGNMSVPTVGSSGAIYGILLASAVMWPDRQILFSFLFPIKMKYFVMIIGAIAFLNSFNVNSGVSDIGHLGGMAAAFLFLKMPKTTGFDPIGGMRESYKAWKLARAKKKFQVYLRKQGSDRGPWVN